VSKLIMCYTQEAHVHDMQHIDMDGTSGVAGGQLPPVPYALPQSL